MWHVPSGDLVHSFQDENDALGYVRRTYDRYGRERAEELALGTEDRSGDSTQVAIGAEQLERALGQAPGRAVETS